MSPKTRLEFAPELNIKDDFIITVTIDESPSEQASKTSDRERVSYRLTPSCTNLSPCSDGEIINQPTVDVDRFAELSDIVGATILQETVTAVDGETDATEADNCEDENNTDIVLDYFPTIVADDYSNDDEFKNIYGHLIEGLSTSFANSGSIFC